MAFATKKSITAPRNGGGVFSADGVFFGGLGKLFLKNGGISPNKSHLAPPPVAATNNFTTSPSAPKNKNVIKQPLPVQNNKLIPRRTPEPGATIAPAGNWIYDFFNWINR